MERQPGDLGGRGLAEASAKTLEKEIHSTGPAPAPSEKNPAIKQEANTPVAPAPAKTEDVPDPDEDDLDDLDDMLDEFSTAAPQPSAKPAAAHPQKAPPQDPILSEGTSDEDFAAQLQAGMADLLGGLETNPEMAAQFETLLTQLGGAGILSEAAGIDLKPTTTAIPSSKAKSNPGKAKAEKADAEDFQETIKKTMDRMRTSGDQATAAAASDNTDDLLVEMMKAMQSSEGGGLGSEEDFSKMLLGMMEQLTNKDILYEPMKELHDKFPEWMKHNDGKVPEDDMKRYKEQQGFVKEIVDRFELKTYKDENVDDREYIVERMQKMQAAGSPPPDLVGDMAAAQEAFGAPEEGCPTQ